MAIPSTLFQYRPPSCWAFEGLRQQTLRFTAPGDFNDPYDCNTVPQNKQLTNEEFAILLQQALDNPRLRGHIGRQGTRDMLEIVLSGQDQARIGEEKRKYIDGVNKIIKPKWEQLRTSLLGAVCLSERNNNLLMWSHYANHGEGFCFEFDTQAIQSLSETPVVKIRYSTMPPDASIFLLRMMSRDEDLWELLSHKSTDWMYEQEWRLFLFNRDGLSDSDRLKKYDKRALKAIYFGSEATDETRSRVSDILKKTGQRAKLFRGERSHDEYGLTFHALPLD